LRRDEAVEDEEPGDRRGRCENEAFGPARAARVEPPDRGNGRRLKERRDRGERVRERAGEISRRRSRGTAHDRRRIQAELVAREQDARAEALDLQAARGLGVEAVPEPAGREDGERQDDERGDGREHAERAQGAAATCDLPDVDRRQRDDDQGIELRRRSEPEQAEPEQLAPA